MKNTQSIKQGLSKAILPSVLAAAMALPLTATAADFVIDTKDVHASVGMKVSHLNYSFITGRFNEFSGEFTYDADNISASSLNVTVDTSSLDTNHAERDKHLTSDDFIGSAEYPEATFVSSNVIDMGDGDIKIEGDLTLHGMTKPFTINASLIGEGSDPWGGYRAGFEGNGRIELADFGIKVAGAASYVELDIVIEGIQQ